MTQGQPTEMDALITRCGTVLREFDHTFRPEALYIPTPQDEETNKFLDLLVNPAIAHALINAHRDWGKTSWVVTAILQRILYRLANCIMYCSLTEDTATPRTDALKRELERNRLIVDTFGNLRSEKWAQKEWCTIPMVEDGVELHPGTQVVPRGIGQPVRGWLYDNKYRPDYVVVDDIQTRKTVKSKTLRDEAWDWLNGEVLGCFSHRDKLGPKEFPPKLIVIGNMLHEDCVVNRLREEAEKPGSLWGDNYLILPLCDDSLKSRRPEFVSDKKVKRIYQHYKNMGDLDIFAQEYQCEVVAASSKAFKQEYYRYYDEEEENLGRRGGIETVVSVDATNSKTEASCPCGIVVQSVDLITGAIYVREVIQERMHIDEQYTTAIDLALRYKAHVISCGTQGAKEWITFAFENAIRMRSAPLEFVEIPETRREGAKAERVGGLIPLYRTGMIRHASHVELDGVVQSHCIPLELAQAKYPHSRYWDAMDAQSQILWLLDNTERFMHANDQRTDGGVEDEYEELKDDDEEEMFDWGVQV